MRITPADLADPRVIAVFETHLARALEITPRESAHALDLAGLRSPDLEVWAAWDGETLMGVGALKSLGPDAGEVKSMHTPAAVRGRGAASAILGHIIATAQARGYRRLSLETGSMDYFAPARALYQRHGFTACEPFAGYRPDPHSVFMTLELGGLSGAVRAGGSSNCSRR
ncbi:MAG TPA: GNAT family N-acetyltransferase [Caulobacteraceae bacterium]|jgi:putative acetyltransferase